MEKRKQSRLGVGISTTVHYRVAGKGKTRREVKVQNHKNHNKNHKTE